jgi:hypothetical protein
MGFRVFSLKEYRDFKSTSIAEGWGSVKFAKTSVFPTFPRLDLLLNSGINTRLRFSGAFRFERASLLWFPKSLDSFLHG